MTRNSVRMDRRYVSLCWLLLLMLGIIGCNQSNDLGSLDSTGTAVTYKVTKIAQVQTISALEQTEIALTKIAAALTPGTPTPFPSSTQTESPSPTSTSTPTLTPTITPTSPPECINIGCLAPDFTLPDLKDNRISLSDFRGQAILLNFWATWCEPCKHETPFLQLLYEKYQSDDFMIIGVNTDEEETVNDVSNFVEEYGMKYVVLLDTDLDVASDYEASYYTRGIPFTFFIDSNGVIRDIEDEEINVLNLETKINSLIKGSLQATPTPLADSTFHISNNSAATICDIYISPTSSSSWGDNWLEDNSIPPGEEFSFDLPSGDYDILMKDCEGHQILSMYEVGIDGLYELDFTNPEESS